MIPIALRSRLVRHGLAALSLIALIAFLGLAHATLLRGVYKDGARAERALWEAEIAKREAILASAVRTAREGALAEGMRERERLAAQASALERALDEARSLDEDFARAQRVPYPDDYFRRVCDARPDCRHPD